MSSASTRPFPASAADSASVLPPAPAQASTTRPPGGDPFRSYSGYAVWNRSRRSVTVDLKQPDGLEAFRRLADTADVLVETFRPGVMDRLGIGFDALHARNERLVYASCPAYPDGRAPGTAGPDDDRRTQSADRVAHERARALA